MPKGIYLDASKLTKKDLAQQIFSSINDKNMYYEYFKWHNHYRYEDPEETPETDPYCKLCEYIHKWNGTKVVANLTYWWNEMARYE